MKLNQFSPLQLFCAIISTFCLPSPAISWEPVTNDLFEDRIRIFGEEGSLAAHNFGVVQDVSERNIGGDNNRGVVPIVRGGFGVWWTWIAPKSGKTQWKVAPDSYYVEPIIDIYQGDTFASLG